MGKCTSCFGPLARVRQYDYKSRVFRKIYTGNYVFRCAKCCLTQVDTAFVSDDLLLHYYENEYRNSAQIGVETTALNTAWYEARGKALSGLAYRHVDNADRIFELGAGYGYNLKAMSNMFPSADLFTDEIDSDLKGNAASMEDGGWDIVILSHVLEHFSDPVQLLKKALENLTIDGRVIIEVPNDRDGIFPINGPDEPHLIFFNSATLSETIDRAGGNIVEIYTAGPTNRDKTVVNRLRNLVRKLLEYAPSLRRLHMNRTTSKLSDQGFSEPNDDGIFLRAIVSSK